MHNLPETWDREKNTILPQTNLQLNIFYMLKYNGKKWLELIKNIYTVRIHIHKVKAKVKL